MLGLARLAADPGKASLRPAAGEERLHRPLDLGPKRPRAWLEALLVGIQVAIEVPLEQLVVQRSLRLTRAIVGGLGLVDEQGA